MDLWFKNRTGEHRKLFTIDEVVGNGRLPTFADLEDLPYIRALVLELLRWGAIAPLGAPHYIKEEDVYEGMRIPKGSMVITNIRSAFSSGLLSLVC